MPNNPITICGLYVFVLEFANMDTVLLGLIMALFCFILIFLTSFSVLYWFYQWLRMRFIWCWYWCKGVDFFPEQRPIHGPDRPLYIPTVSGRVSSILSELHSQGLVGKLGDLVFLDCGSGKGALVAEVSRLGFKRVLGVEIDEHLNNVAWRNIRRLAVADCSELIWGDIFDLGARLDDVNVVYAYGQFKRDQLEAFCDDLQASLIRKKRNFLFIYTHLVDRDVLEGYGFRCVYEKNSARFGDYCTAVFRFI